MNTTLVMARMVDPLFIHVCYIYAAVRSDLDVDWTTPVIFAFQDITNVFRLK